MEKEPRSFLSPSSDRHIIAQHHCLSTIQHKLKEGRKEGEADRSKML